MTRRLQVKSRLVAVSEEMDRARSEIEILREQLRFQEDVLEETRVRLLVAETPLADREFRIASDDHRRIERVLQDAEGTLAALAEEQDRLLAALSETALPEREAG
ncbi:MAG TPA: hypothetical protein VEO00_08715 [Actinomycetota bacterium]|nr:hypothetical protein [Actinomycetota bacterium]